MTDRAQADRGPAHAAPAETAPSLGPSATLIGQALLHRKLQRRAAARGTAVQRAVTEGYSGAANWNAGRTNVDSQGHAARNGAAVPGAMSGNEAVGANAVIRIPLSGLSHIAGGTAMVVVPAMSVLQANNTVDVLINFHGAGAQNDERSNTASSGGQQSPDKVRTHDLQVSQVPQQVAAYGGALVVISPELLATTRNVAQDGLVDEVFSYLKQQGVLLSSNARGRTIIAGHSRGGQGAVDEAAEHEPGQGTPQETASGLLLFDAVQEAIQPAIALIQRRLRGDLQRMTGQSINDQLTYLRTNGYMVRILGCDPPYAGDVRPIRVAIDTFFSSTATTLGADPAVIKGWRGNYQVALVPTPDRRDDRHSSMVSTGAGGPIWNRDYIPGTGHLEQSLNDWRTQHAVPASASQTSPPPPQQQQQQQAPPAPEQQQSPSPSDSLDGGALSGGV